MGGCCWAWGVLLGTETQRNEQWKPGLASRWASEVGGVSLGLAMATAFPGIIGSSNLVLIPGCPNPVIPVADVKLPKTLCWLPVLKDDLISLNELVQ
jgi:hypothetical protein